MFFSSSTSCYDDMFSTPGGLGLDASHSPFNIATFSAALEYDSFIGLGALNTLKEILWMFSLMFSKALILRNSH